VAVAAFYGFYGGPIALTDRALVWIATGYGYLPTRVVDVSQPTPTSSANPEWPGIPII
jgi:hypothetical protein